MALITPTGPDLVNAVAAGLNAAARARTDAVTTLPSLRRRAYLLVYEAGVITVTSETVPVAQSTMRGA